MEDSSLDEFLDTDERDDTESPQSEDPENRPSEDGEPAVSTSRWAGTDDSCPECEAEGVRLWNDDEAFVCGECKSW